MQPDEPHWSLVERFFIDDGELDGITAPMAFVMGVEYCQFLAELIANKSEFDRMVMKENEERILKMCWNQKRHATSEPAGEGVPNWKRIHVK